MTVLVNSISRVLVGHAYAHALQPVMLVILDQIRFLLWKFHDLVKHTCFELPSAFPVCPHIQDQFRSPCPIFGGQLFPDQI